MSAEEIIRIWKNEQASRAIHSNEEPEGESENALVNPAGEQELSDEELALIEGGDASSKCSCVEHSCKGLALA